MKRVAVKRVAVLALAVALSFAGCTTQQGQAAGSAVGTVGPAICQAFAPILDSAGAFWGTACSAIASLIGAAISDFAKSGKLATRAPCTGNLTPIAPSKGGPAQAWVCAGPAESIARRVVDSQ